MTTTGTYAFNPSAADVVLNAYRLVGVKRTEITEDHLEDAAFQANLMGVEFTNRQPNRWQMDTETVTLIADTATYNLPAETVAVTAAWLVQDIGNGQTISRPLGPLSAVDYANIAMKQQAGTPISYFFSLLTPIPTITLWLVPNQNPEFTLNVQIFKQQQDTTIPGGYTLDTPYRFLDAYTWGLASRLAVLYPDANRPTLPVDLNTAFEAKFRLAAQLDQERVPLRLTPNFSGYYPR
jgi:hypothetical protein